MNHDVHHPVRRRPTALLLFVLDCGLAVTLGLMNLSILPMRVRDGGRLCRAAQLVNSIRMAVLRCLPLAFVARLWIARCWNARSIVQYITAAYR